MANQQVATPATNTPELLPLEKRLLEHARHCVADALPYTQDVVQNLERMRDLYKGAPRYQSNDASTGNWGERVETLELEAGQSHFPNTHTGECSANVQAATAAFVGAIFSTDRPFDAVPYNEGDKSKAMVVRNAIAYSMEQQRKFAGQSFKAAIKDAAKRFFKFQSTIVKTDVVKKMVETDDKGPQVMFSPRVKVVPRQNILIANPARAGLQRQDQPFIAEYFTAHLEDLYEFERKDIPITIKMEIQDPETGESVPVEVKGTRPDGVYLNLDMLASRATTKRNEHNPESSTTETTTAQTPEATGTDLTEYPSLKGYELWARNPIPRWLRLKESDVDGQAIRSLATKWGLDEQKLLNAAEDLILTYVDNDVLIGVRTNWFDHKRRPYHSARYEDLDNRFDGLSMLMRQDALQEMLDSIFSLTFAGIKKLLNNAKFKDKRALIDKEEAKKAGNTPHGICDVDVSKIPGQSVESAFVDFPANDYLSSAIPLINVITGFMRRITIPADVQGFAQAGSATEARLNATTGQQKLDMAFEEFVESILLPVVEDFRDLLVQYKTEDWAIRVFGEAGLDWQTVTPQDLQTKVDIKIIADLSAADRNLKAQYITNMLNVAGKATPIEYFLNALRTVYKLLRFREDEVNDLVPRAEKETPPERENEVLEKGQAVPVRADDNHKKHILVHMMHQNKTEATIAHIREHFMQDENQQSQIEQASVDPQQAAIAAQMTKDWSQTMGSGVGSQGVQARIQDVSKAAADAMQGGEPPQDVQQDQTQTLGL